MPVVQRNEMWLNNKKKKIESAREQMKDKDIEGCTFEPKLHQYKPPRPQSRSNLHHDDSKRSLNRSSQHNISHSHISNKEDSKN
jgi:hypothetical protein